MKGKSYEINGLQKAIWICRDVRKNMNTWWSKIFYSSGYEYSELRNILFTNLLFAIYYLLMLLSLYINYYTFKYVNAFSYF